MAGLDREQVARLQMPFAVREHDWVNGNIYVKKSAIKGRLGEVDPAWTIGPPTLSYVADDLIVMTATLTICGVERAGLGTGIIRLTKTDNKKVVELAGFELSRERAKAFKTAATDCLQRAFQQFGGCDYLKTLPKGLADAAALERYFASLNSVAPVRNGAQSR